MEVKMEMEEVWVSGPGLRLRVGVAGLPAGSCVADLRDLVTRQQGLPPLDFYVGRNGRRAELQEAVQAGASYQLLPRLCGGKGGFGSMLRALGAQIEKTTNREACRDLSGRRLRDVNHEKEMAEWLKKQSEREAEKEQRRAERLQRKLSEPRHQFSDADYQQQCHDLAERLEDSVLKGMQAASSGLVHVEERAAKRTKPEQSQHAAKRKCFWTGGDLDQLDTSEDDEDQDQDQDEAPSTSSSGLSRDSHRQEPEPEPDPGAAGRAGEAGRSVSMATPSSSSCAAELPEASSCHTQQPKEAEQEEVRAEEEAVRGEQEEVRAQQEVVVPVQLEEVRAQQEVVVPVQLEEVRAQQEVVVPVQLEEASCAQQLEALGLDVLKEELSRRGLKCGGTLAERAARLFSVRGLTAEQIEPALLAKPAKGKRK
ncbi:splicing regulator SDE2 isoform X3 [Myripristis murdjan]|uniref:splicing regulator SDE2 isoform X3 n=1 Tax=Myripristis murdjan TaxID=586833 RepID=UPI001175D8C7|nr:replication stress response regulator SDE2 isoform X3 [Myripristis murdjan]